MEATFLNICNEKLAFNLVAISGLSFSFPRLLRLQENDPDDRAFWVAGREVEMAKKNSIPKKIAGYKVPKALRKSSVINGLRHDCRRDCRPDRDNRRARRSRGGRATVRKRRRRQSAGRPNGGSVCLFRATISRHWSGLSVAEHHPDADDEHVWAGWGAATLEELVHTWPARAQPGEYQRMRGWMVAADDRGAAGCKERGEVQGTAALRQRTGR